MAAQFFTPNGRPFTLENTTDRELLFTITTAAGTVIEFRVPPGGKISMPTILENLDIKGGVGAGPGILPLNDPGA